MSYKMPVSIAICGVKGVVLSVLTDAPIINCSESQRTRAPLGYSASFRCSIRANPNCDDVTWTYADGTDVNHDLHTDANIRTSYKVRAYCSARLLVEVITLALP